jgi:hypothetical protein
MERKYGRSQRQTRRNYKLSGWTFYGEAEEFPDQTMSGMTG